MFFYVFLIHFFLVSYFFLFLCVSLIFPLQRNAEDSKKIEKTVRARVFVLWQPESAGECRIYNNVPTCQLAKQLFSVLYPYLGLVLQSSLRASD